MTTTPKLRCISTLLRTHRVQTDKRIIRQLADCGRTPAYIRSVLTFRKAFAALCLKRQTMGELPFADCLTELAVSPRTARNYLAVLFTVRDPTASGHEFYREGETVRMTHFEGGIYRRHVHVRAKQRAKWQRQKQAQRERRRVQVVQSSEPPEAVRAILRESLGLSTLPIETVTYGSPPTLRLRSTNEAEEECLAAAHACSENRALTSAEITAAAYREIEEERRRACTQRAAEADKPTAIFKKWGVVPDLVAHMGITQAEALWADSNMSRAQTAIVNRGGAFVHTIRNYRSGAWR